MTRQITRYDEDQFLKNRIAGNRLFMSDFTYADVINALEQKSLSLEISQEEGIEVLSKKDLGFISKSIPFLIKIVQKPRTFIRSREEKLPVETAKRINNKAISILSRDSNDWYARTALNVKPKYITSDVNEETIDIYENRFICALIDKITLLIHETYVAYMQELDEYIKNRTFRELSDLYHFDLSANSSLSFYYKICDNSFANQMSNYEADLKNMVETVQKLEKKVRILHYSELYKELKNKRKVRNPVQKTNILMYDFSYNKAYRLWNELDKTHFEKREKLIREEIPEDIKERNYVFYCFLCLCACLNDMGFRETDDARIRFGNNGLNLSKPLSLMRDFDSKEITLRMEENDIVLSLLVRKAPKHEEPKFKQKTSKLIDYTDKREEIWFCPKYIDLDEMDAEDIYDKSQYALDELSSGCDDIVRSKFRLHPTNIYKINDEKVLQDYLVQRLSSIGDHFSTNDACDFKKWSDYHAGFISVRPSDLRSNFLRLEKAINQNIVYNRLLRNDPTPLDRCPVCGSTNFKKENNGDARCFECQRKFSMTKCKNCGKDNIVWVKYVDDKFLENEEIMKDFDSLSFCEKIGQIELMMRECTTTAFDIVKDGDRYKLKTICPHCCCVLGDKADNSS